MKKKFNWSKKLIISLALSVSIVGGATTIAFLSSTTPTIVNEFTPADVNTVIEEEVDDRTIESGADRLKAPVVVNNGPSIAFIRARITITPSTAGVTLLAGEWDSIENPSEFTETLEVFDGENFVSNGDWIYDSDDNCYYYQKPVAVGASTATLFDAFNLTENADVTIYEESVHSGDYKDTTEDVNVDVIKEFFASVNAAEDPESGIDGSGSENGAEE